MTPTSRSGVLRPILRPALRVVIATVLLCALVPTPASADKEPTNNTLVGAEGPLNASITYSGKLGTGSDVADWYYLYVHPQVEMTVNFTNSCEGEGNIALTGRDGLGWDQNDGHLVQSYSKPLTYTTPPGAPRLYYLRVYCEYGKASYSFKVTTQPVNSLVPGPTQFGPPVTLGEPNEFISQAIGPLAGSVTYRGVTGTSNDVDWFYFYAKPQRELEISVTAAECTEGGSLYFYTEESDDDWRERASINLDTVDRIRYTTGTSLRRYYIRAHCEQSSYLFKIEPADAIASEQCVTALSAWRAAASKSQSEQRKLRRARRSHVALMRTLKRRIKQGRRVGAAKRTMRMAKRRHPARIKRRKASAAAARQVLGQHRTAANAACA